VPEPHLDAVTDAFRERILNGEYGISGRLPSLRMLSGELHVSHDTVNKVIQRLQAEGLLVSKGRAGVFVNKRRPRIPTHLTRFSLYLDQQGLVPEETLLDGPSLIPAPDHAAHAMGIERGTPVVRLQYRMGMATVPYCLVESFYPTELVNGSLLESMQRDATFDVLSAIKEAHGKVIKKVHEDVIGRLPTSEEQRLLEIVRSTPVLEVSRTNYASDDKKVILFNRIIFVASYFILSYDYTFPGYP